MGFLLHSVSFFSMSDLFDQEFYDRKEWRIWLEKNHVVEKEIWVIIHKKQSSRKGLKYLEAVEEAICFGWIDSKMQSIDVDTFRQRFSPRRKNSIWSKKNKERSERMIQEKKMKAAGFTTINIAKENGNWDAAYSSNMIMKIPKDLQKALEENKIAWKNFINFTIYFTNLATHFKSIKIFDY